MAAKTYVLVHGGFHGGWCYARVAEALRRLGHRVYTPTLTGLGERSHLAHGEINCSLHIQDVLNVIQWEQLSDVVLCGHSYGGIVISGVADKIPERIAALVYLDAGIPQDGSSILDIISQAERDTLSKQAVNGMMPPVPAKFFAVNEADQPMVDALCTPMPFATLTEKLKITGAFHKIARKIFVRATGWDGAYAHGAYARVKEDADWLKIDVACGHDVMLDATDKTVEILLHA